MRSLGGRATILSWILSQLEAFEILHGAWDFLRSIAFSDAFIFNQLSDSQRIGFLNKDVSQNDLKFSEMRQWAIPHSTAPLFGRIRKRQIVNMLPLYPKVHPIVDFLRCAENGIVQPKLI